MLWQADDQRSRFSNDVRFRPGAGKLEAGQFVQTTLDTWQCSALLLPVRRLVPVELHRLNRIFMGDSMILEKNL